MLPVVSTRICRRLFAVALYAATAATATAAGYTDTFTGGINLGRWSYFGDPTTGIETVEAAGGNPGAWLHCTCNKLDCLDSFAPQPRTQLGFTSPFTANYRSQHVVAVGIDLILLDVDFSAAGRPLSVLLRNDAGTAGDPFDDLIAYHVGAVDVPEVGQGWRSFSFDIPSQGTTLPEDWRILQGTGNDDEDWNRIITDVDQLGYFYGDPEFFFIFQQWEPGLDNARIEYAALAGDMNCDGSVGVSDIGAFVLALTDPAGYANAFPECDILNGDLNGDSQVSVGDIGLFVALLTG